MSGAPRAAQSFLKIFVADLDRAARFYSEAFGYEPGGRMAAPIFDEIILRPTKGQGGAIVLCRWRDGRALHHGDAHGAIGFDVDDVDRVHARALAAGGVSCVGPRNVGPARLSIVTDLDGHELELLDLSGGRASPP